jgi:hypothetical protein
MMCASLAGVLFAIERLNHKKITLEPFTGARAEEVMESGITAKVRRAPSSVPADGALETKPVDKNQGSH